MNARPRVLIAEPADFTPAAIERLRTACDVELSVLPQGGMYGAMERYDAIWFRLAHRVRAEDVPPKPRCRVLACAVTGLDHIDLATCHARGVRVVSLRGETLFLRRVRATAELTLALALALWRRIPSAHGSVLEGVWDRDRFRGRELYEKTAGIVGVGRLGAIAGEYFAALGMRVLGFDPFAESMTPGIERVSALETLLRAADVVSLHVSYSEATHHLISATELGLMKQSAILINTSRGGVLDLDALLGALKEQRIAGAALDVLEGEPDVGPDHPAVVWARAHDNLLLTPHIGGNTFESLEKCELFIADRLLEALA